jgi:hypothetical protein
MRRSRGVDWCSTYQTPSLSWKGSNSTFFRGPLEPSGRHRLLYVEYRVCYPSNRSCRQILAYPSNDTGARRPLVWDEPDEHKPLVRHRTANTLSACCAGFCASLILNEVLTDPLSLSSHVYLINRLRFGELRLAHGNLLARVAFVPESSPVNPSQFGGSL